MQEQRLRRPFPCITLTTGNVLADVPAGRVSGTVGLIAAPRPCPPRMVCGTNTLSNNVGPRSPASATVRDLPGNDPGGRR
jgi:hypothetical protein